MPPEILQVVRELDRARGIPAVAFALARAWRRAGLDVTTFCLRSEAPAGTDLGRIETCPGLDRFCRAIPWRRARLALEVPLFTRRATRRARARGGALVIVHGDGRAADLFVAHSCHRAALAAKRAAGRWAYRFWPLHAYLLARERSVATSPAIRRIVAVSPEVAAEFAQLYAAGPERVAVIPNGVDRERFRPPLDRPALRRALEVPETSALLLMIANQFETKGLRIALAALARLGGGSPAHLIVIGDDHVRPYRRLAQQLGIASRVRFLGHRSDVAPYVAAADLLLLLSEYEAFGLVGLEALSSGVPILATCTGGIHAYLRNGENGFFVERTPDAVAARLRALFEHPDLLARLRERARPSTEAFDWSAIAPQYASLAASVRAEPHP
jgi:glycosyltransferase involved in cell wall biosynthesis